MLTHVVVSIVFTLGCWQCAAQVSGESSPVSDASEAARQNRAHKLSEIRARMENPDRSKREAAFEDLLKFLPASGSESMEGGVQASYSLLGQNTDEAKLVRGALIRLLSRENIRSRSKPSGSAKPTTETPESGTEAEGSEDEYYPELIGIVADFNDERAIPALLGAANTGGMATRGVARYGKKALDPVLEQISGRDPDLASGALFVIRDMLEFRLVSDPDSLLKIKNALRSALARRNFEVRDSAIWIIEYLPDREEFVPTLTEIAERDPVTLPGKPDDGGDGGKFYPLRQQAR